MLSRTLEAALWQFFFIVDCQPLAQITNGQAPLLQPELAPAFERMTTILFKMIEANWKPHRLSSNPVLWHRRENNKVADFIVNHTMERQSDWFQECRAPIPNVKASEANYICHSDGGTRADSCSATGWIIEAVVTRGEFKHTFPIAMSGTFLSQPISSFTVETIALDEALSYLSKVLARSIFLH